jgi:mono/diheme cytochrome c family protein
MRNRAQTLMHRAVRLPVLLAVAASIGTYGAALADEASDILAGRELAEKACSRCHVVVPQPGPPFAEIANGSRAEPNALLDFLRSTHSDVSHPSGMPNSELTAHEIDQISAYLASLRAGK